MLQRVNAKPTKKGKKKNAQCPCQRGPLKRLFVNKKNRKNEGKKKIVHTGGTVIVVSKVLVDTFPLFRLYNVWRGNRGGTLRTGLFLDHGVRREVKGSGVQGKVKAVGLFVCFY